jgi:hypothetical protein
VRTLVVALGGNPLEDISVLGSGEDRLPIIMKDGRFHKRTIQRSLWKPIIFLKMPQLSSRARTGKHTIEGMGGLVAHRIPIRRRSLLQKVIPNQ